MPQDLSPRSSPAALLIPEPRAGRAQRAACVLLAVCFVVLCLTGEPLVPITHRACTQLAALQLGVLLKGCCCLAEEIFHLHSRHHSSLWRVLCACFPPRWHLALLLIGCSAYLEPQEDKGNSPRLVLACLCQLLVLALGLQKLSAVEVSELTESSKKNVAHGLAWSYYVGYLKIVLPRLKECMEEISRAHPMLRAHRDTWKLHILIPLSCDIWDDLEKADSKIQYLTDLPETTLTRAGIKRRVYKHSLYAIRDEDNKLRPCVLEFASPLQTLCAMSQDEWAAFSREQRLEQAQLFYRTLRDILGSSRECAGTYRLIAYEEPAEAESHFLSGLILWHLQQQQREEYMVQEELPLDSGSMELSLQVSTSDLPQPLRSDRP
ncbi:stimulator of interferon genes protein isoform X2 [Numida meleagris]|uniref:stimulator of interferon genes protein isoform X2 n=1 Tax=Numida meleagris TaxID=8996 RepID=UPI000B3D9E11|nr:stimulator of interferon genes protein isoform X2 [Numida meleagris]